MGQNCEFHTLNRPLKMNLLILSTKSHRMNRIFSADLIFSGDSPAIKNGWIECDYNGKIISINESAIPKNAEIFNGIIVPGFINTHCHLELSHLLGCITEKQGMTAFISSLFAQRFSFSTEEQLAAMQKAEDEMLQNGIVAVGDISNFESSFEVKKNARLYYHTFVEVFGLDPMRAEEIILKAKSLSEKFSCIEKHTSSLVPHAPYSVSDWLFELLSAEYKNNSPVSIHMEESMDEYQFCYNKTGPFAKLFSAFGIDYSLFKATPDATPLQRTLPKLIASNNLLLVHNTYTTIEEIDWATSQHENIYWCLCPNANQYITNRLPDLNFFNNDRLKVTIGTDSLASNHSLNVLDELKIIQRSNHDIPFDRLIKWATINGAAFLGIEKTFGSISEGKTPGLVLLEGIDVESLIINDSVKIRRIV